MADTEASLEARLSTWDENRISFLFNTFSAPTALPASILFQSGPTLQTADYLYVFRVFWKWLGL